MPVKTSIGILKLNFYPPHENSMPPEITLVNI